MEFKRRANKRIGLHLLTLSLIAALGASVASHAECMGFNSWSATSPTKLVTARYFWRDKAIQVEQRDANNRVLRAFTLAGKPHPPGQLLVYDDGTLVSVGAWCGWTNESQTIIFYEAKGNIRWTVGLNALLPDQKDIVERGIDSDTHWYREIVRVGTADDPRLLFKLLNFDQLEVRLRDGVVTRRAVSTAELGTDATALKGRAAFLILRGQTEAGEQLLRSVLARNPKDYQAANQLAYNLMRREQPREAADVWARLEKEMPLPELSQAMEYGPRPASLSDLRYRRLEALMAAHAYAEVLEVTTQHLDNNPPETRFEVLQGVALVYLDRIESAKSVFDRTIERASVAALAAAVASRQFDNVGSRFASDLDPIARSLTLAGHRDLAQHYGQQVQEQARKIASKAPVPKDLFWVKSRANELLMLGDSAGAITLYESIAKQNRDSEVARKLGDIYFDRPNGPDIAAATRWYTIATRAPEHWDDHLQAHTALCYLHRHTAPPNFTAAASACRSASNKGGNVGLFWYGILHAAGLGVKRDETEAMRLIGEARKALYPLGWSTIPSHFSSPMMVPDFQWAAKVLEPIAATGNTTAQATLGMLFNNSAWLGTAANKERSNDYRRLAAKGGDAKSMLALGSCEADEWWRKAVEAGEIWGYYYMADCHINGRVSEPDLTSAEAMLRKFSLAYFQNSPCPPQDARRCDPAEELYKKIEVAQGRKIVRPVFPEVK